MYYFNMEVLIYFLGTFKLFIKLLSNQCRRQKVFRGVFHNFVFSIL